MRNEGGMFCTQENGLLISCVTTTLCPPATLPPIPAPTLGSASHPSFLSHSPFLSCLPPSPSLQTSPHTLANGTCTCLLVASGLSYLIFVRENEITNTEVLQAQKLTLVLDSSISPSARASLFFLATSHCMCNPSSQTRDQTCVPCSGSAKS